MMLDRITGTLMALAGFALSIILGLAARNTTETILWRALVAMTICYLVGSLIGLIGHRTIQESVEQYKQAHPIRTHLDEDESGAATSDEPDQSIEMGQMADQAAPSEESEGAQRSAVAAQVAEAQD